MLILHNEVKPKIAEGEPVNSSGESVLASEPVNPSPTAETTPPTQAQILQEDRFEKALADPEAPTPFHLNVYVRTFLGGLLFLSLIAFYAAHLTKNGSLGTYGEAYYPSDVNRLPNH